MTPIDADDISEQVYVAAKAAFSKILRENATQHFYAFALFTDDSLQFLNPAANSEEALTATVERYREKVDPKYGRTSTRTGMRWSYGDWGFFVPKAAARHFDRLNEILIANIDSDEETFQAGVKVLWPAILRGFQRLDQEQFFGSGPERSKITLLLVGDLPTKLVDSWVTALNPPDVAERFINWNADAPDDEPE